MAKSVEQGSVDVLGLLPGPAIKANGGACDLLHGEVFAYAVSGSVAVVDVRIPSKQSKRNSDSANLHLGMLPAVYKRTSDIYKVFCGNASSYRSSGPENAAGMRTARTTQEFCCNSCELVRFPSHVVSLSAYVSQPQSY